MKDPLGWWQPIKKKRKESSRLKLRTNDERFDLWNDAWKQKIDLINDDQNSRFSQPDDSIRTT